MINLKDATVRIECLAARYRSQVPQKLSFPDAVEAAFIAGYSAAESEIKKRDELITKLVDNLEEVEATCAVCTASDVLSSPEFFTWKSEREK